MKLPLLAVLSLSLATAAVAELTPDQIKTMSPAAIEKKLPAEHPSAYYAYAGRLFAEGKKDDAVFWFYAGQLRYRVHLKAHPELKPDGDPAVFSSLNATIGKEINEYAGGDPKLWGTQIERVLAWDEKTDNSFTSKSKFKKEYDEIRAGLSGLKAHIEQNMEQIREQRKKAGLENRG